MNRTLRLEDKIQIIKDLKTGKGVTDLAIKYNVSKSYIYYIRKSETRFKNHLTSLQKSNLNVDHTTIHPFEATKFEDQNGILMSKNEDFFDGTKMNLEHTSQEDPSQMMITEGSSLSLDLQLKSGEILLDTNLMLCEDSSVSEEITVVTNPTTISDNEPISQDTTTLILSGDPMNKMEELLSLEESSRMVFCSSYKSFKERMTNFELDTYSQFIISKTRGNFTSDNEVKTITKRLQWWKGGSLDGIPYLVAASRYFSCRYGMPCHSRPLESCGEEREKQQQLRVRQRKKKKPQDSKKLGCPVKFVANRCVFFPGLKVSSDNCDILREREEMKKIFKRNPFSFQYETKFICFLPDDESHRFHEVGPPAAVKEMLDRRILERIKILVKCGKTDPDDIREELEDYANAELKIPDKQRRRFYPNRLDIINTVNRIKMKIRKEEIEQDRIKDMVDGWRVDSDVFWRPFEESDPYSKFILVYQNEEMKRLFRLYGKNCILIDPVHKLCEFIWPLYFLTVNTNFNYQVVGFFIVQHESKVSIVEGLNVIKSWNPKVEPKYALVSGPWEEIKIIESVYPTIKVFVSSFHRDLAWRKKIARKENINLDQTEITSLLNEVANASNEEEIRVALANLKESKAYNASSLKGHYENLWHQHIKRWSFAYFPHDLYFMINYEAKKFEEDIMYPYLLQNRTLPLSELINLLITKYIPYKLCTYRGGNHKAENGDSVPSFLKHCSDWVVNKIMKINFEIAENLKKFIIQEISSHQFCVSTELSESCKVSFYPKRKLALCTCSTFMKTKFICKHIFAVGIKNQTYQLSKISKWLFDDQIFRVDSDIPSHLKKNISSHEILSVPSMNSSLINGANNSIKKLREKCKLELNILDSLVLELDETRLKDLLKELNYLRSKVTS